MAGIRENKRNGKVVSYRFTACLDRDANGRQVRKYKTWPVPEDFTPAKAKKTAQRAADEWEQQERKEYQKELELGQAYIIPPEKRRDSFSSFVNDVWLPLYVCNGEQKPTSVAFYKNLSKVIVDYFNGAALQEISSIQIQKFLVYLRKDYRTKQGKPFAAKTVRHYYGALNLIFSYAEKQGLIAANPMLKVDAPKKDKKSIDALSIEQAKQFFAAIDDCPLDFRCMLLLLVTSGIRRGECLGLQWRDINERDCTITIARSVVYTTESGIIVSTPKTADSSRTIPIMPSVLELLQQLKEQTRASNTSVSIKNALNKRRYCVILAL